MKTLRPSPSAEKKYFYKMIFIHKTVTAAILFLFTETFRVSHCLLKPQHDSGSPEVPSSDYTNREQHPDKDNGRKSYDKWRLLRLYPTTEEITKLLLKKIEGLDTVNLFNTRRMGSKIEVISTTLVRLLATADLILTRERINIRCVKVDLAVTSNVTMEEILGSSHNFLPLCSLDHLARKDEAALLSLVNDTESIVERRLNKVADALKEDGCRRRETREDEIDGRKGGDRQGTFHAISWVTLLDDLGISSRRTRQTTENEELDWYGYYRYDAILRFAETLAENNDNVGMIKFGKSVEDRQLFALVFSTNTTAVVEEYEENVAKAAQLLTKTGVRFQTKKKKKSEQDDEEGVKRKIKKLKRERRQTKGRRVKKPMVLIDAGAHAREWIGPAVATYIAHQLATAGKDILRGIDIMIVPLVNPDGYEFSHTTDRMWRKNRSQNGTRCHGVDLNRNWSFQWGSNEGTSDNPCSEDFSGREPFSEPETKALRDLMAVYLSELQMYLAFHSYGQLVLYPWDCDEKSPKDKNLKIMAKKLQFKLSKHGKKYKVGQTSVNLYPACGTSVDYMYNLGVPYPFVLELPNKHSFKLNPNQIEPTAKAVWSALVDLLDKISGS